MLQSKIDIEAIAAGAQNQQRAVALQGSSTKNETKFYNTLQVCDGGCRCKYMYQGTVRHVCALCTRSPTRGTCVTCGRMCCRGCIEDASRQCWSCLGYGGPQEYRVEEKEEEEWKKRRRERRKRRRLKSNHRSGASERRRRIWALGQRVVLRMHLGTWLIMCIQTV